MEENSNQTSDRARENKNERGFVRKPRDMVIRALGAAMVGGLIGLALLKLGWERNVALGVCVLVGFGTSWLLERRGR
jgi:hypothetical protein